MSEKKNWRVVKVTFVESNLAMREAIHKKHQLNSVRHMEDLPWEKLYYKAERMDDL